MSGKVNVQFPEKLQCLFDESKRYIVLYGGRGAGRSWGVARALLIRGAQKPLRILCCREFMTSLKDSVHQLLVDQIHNLGLDDFYTVQNNQIIGRNATTFGFIGLRHNAANIKSWEGADIAWCEESHAVSKNSFDILIPTIRKEGSQIILTFNPELAEDECYQRFVSSPPHNTVVVKMTYADNPFFPRTLQLEMEDCKQRDPTAFQHIWEGQCRTTVEGAVYANEMRLATEQKRIASVPYDPTKPVSVFFDLGWGDYTSLWFVQCIGHEFRFIDSYQNHRERTGHYAEIMQQRGYVYDRIFLPHDAAHESMNAERTTEQILIESFRNASIIVIPNFPGALKTGIQAARNIFPLCWFDKEKCADGLSALRHYHYRVDPATGKVSKEPEHDSSSHFADSFRYCAMAITKDDPEPDYSKKFIKEDIPHRAVPLAATGHWESGYQMGNGDSYDLF